jgi:hypothetical protein
MTSPIHAYFVRSDEHGKESVREVLAGLHLNDVWLRLTTEETPSWGGAPALQIELYDLRDGAPLLPEFLGVSLSKGERTALRLTVDMNRTTVAFELFKDGETRSVYAGNISGFEDDESGEKGVEGFHAFFEEKTGLHFLESVEARSLAKLRSNVAVEGSEAFVRGRYVNLVKGMGRWPEMFRFHDRNMPEGPEEAVAVDGEHDHVALVALDLKQAERLYRLTPAGRVHQFFRRIEPHKSVVFGPMGQALVEALSALEALPPELSIAAAGSTDPTLFELLSLSTSLVYMVGDRLAYLDERFFPLISLSKEPVSRSAVEGSLEEIRRLGVLSAMTEVLPYSVPEGEMMQSFADEELSPPAPWAVTDDGAYEGSLFLLDRARLEELVNAFEKPAFDEQVEAFRKIWYEAEVEAAAEGDPPGTMVEWLARRAELDEVELNRFEDTYVELQHLVGLSHLNDLALALLFYSG